MNYECDMGCMEQPSFTILPRSLGDCPKAGPCKPKRMQKQEETENNMYATSTQIALTSEEAMETRQQKYLLNRLDIAYDKMKQAASRQFGLTDDERPMTAAEMIARIIAGKYVLDDSTKDYRTYNNTADYITWRDPAIKKDQLGFDAAKTKLQTLVTATRDSIMVKPAADGLAALQAFEATPIQ